MTKTFDGRSFEFQMASDVVRDGLGYEAWEITGADKALVMEIFRQDPDGTLSVTVETNPLPFALYEYMTSTARSALLPDGWEIQPDWETDA